MLKPARNLQDLETFESVAAYDKLVDSISHCSDEDDDYVDEGYQGSDPDKDGTAGDNYVAGEAAEDDWEAAAGALEDSHNDGVDTTSNDDDVEDFVYRMNNDTMVMSTISRHYLPEELFPSHYADDFPTVQEANSISDARDVAFCHRLFDEEPPSESEDHPIFRSRPETVPCHRQHVILDSKAIRALSWRAFSAITREHYNWEGPKWAKKLDEFLMPATARSSEEV